MVRKRFSILILGSILILLLVNNTINYISTRNELTENLRRQVNDISAQITISIVRSQNAYRYVDQLMAEQLRTAAIAAKYALPAAYEEIDSIQIRALRDELIISDITLFARTTDDIVGVRSSNEREIGLSTKGWDNYYDAFTQLFTKQEVSGLSYGQSLQNYWAGEIAPSASTLEDVKNKFGYYYDGTTNYMINSIMDTQYVKELEKYTGVETILKDTLSQHDHLMELTLFNPLSFSLPDGELVNKRNGIHIPQYVNRKVLFGTYDLQHADDAAMIEQAFRDKKTVHRTMQIDGKNVLRTYYPVFDDVFELPYVIGISTDYGIVERQLSGSLVHHAAATGAGLAVSAVLLWLLYRYIHKTRNKIAQDVQNDYNEEVQSLFVAVRGQRHDFVNHLQTLKAMMDANRTEQLKRYLQELVAETVAVNDIVSIGHPAVAAIVQSKVAQALHRRITFTYDLENMHALTGVKGVKSVDLVKILANLIDNSFEEALRLEPEQRLVHLHGRIEGGLLVFIVTNPLHAEMTKEHIEQMFQPQYTTKGASEHSGLGLPIVRAKVRQYRGKLEVTLPTPRSIAFTVSLPIGEQPQRLPGARP